MPRHFHPNFWQAIQDAKSEDDNNSYKNDKIRKAHKERLSAALIRLVNSSSNDKTKTTTIATTADATNNNNNSNSNTILNNPPPAQEEISNNIGSNNSSTSNNHSAIFSSLVATLKHVFTPHSHPHQQLLQESSANDNTSGERTKIVLLGTGQSGKR